MEDTGKKRHVDPFDKIKQQKDEALKKAKEEALRREKEINARRRAHFMISSIILTVALSVAIVIYPNAVTATLSAILICIFFCIGVSYQKTINTALVIALGIAGVIGTFYFLLNS